MSSDKIINHRVLVQLLNMDLACDLDFFFYSVLRPFQYYFSSYETGQLVGGAKTGEPPRKNTWHTRKQNLACLTCSQSGARTHTRHSGELLTARPRGSPPGNMCCIKCFYGFFDTFQMKNPRGATLSILKYSKWLTNIAKST